jgi:hypothetical protein
VGKYPATKENLLHQAIRSSQIHRINRDFLIVGILSFLIVSSSSSFLFMTSNTGSQSVIVKELSSVIPLSLTSAMAKSYDKSVNDNSVSNNDNNDNTNNNSPSKGGSILAGEKFKDLESQLPGMPLPFEAPSVPSSSSTSSSPSSSTPTHVDETSSSSLSSMRSLDLPDQTFSSAAIAPGDLLHILWDDGDLGNLDILHNRVGADHDPTTSNISTNPTEAADVEVAVSGSTIHVVYEHDPVSPGDFDIFYQRSTNGGASFGPVINLSNNLGDSLEAEIAVSGNDVHVVWFDATTGDGDIFYRRSTDGGVSFTDPIKNLSSSSTHSDWPSIAVSGNNVHVVWAEFQASVEILYRRSTNGGSSFPNVIKTVSAVGDNSNQPEVAVSGNNLHVVWKDIAPGNIDVFYRKSATNGDTFEAIKNLSGNSGDPFLNTRPHIAVNGNNVHVVWDDNTSGNFEILYRRSTNGGSSFPNIITNISNNDLDSLLPAIAVSGNNIYVVWTQNMPSGPVAFDVFYRTSADNGVSFPITQTNISNSPENLSETPAIAVSQS